MRDEIAKGRTFTVWNGNGSELVLNTLGGNLGVRRDCGTTLDRGVEKGQSVVVAWSRDRVIILLHAGVTTRPLLSPLLNYTFGVLPEIIEDVQFYCTNWYVVAFGQLIFLL